jgi:hypothetical protein
MSLTFFFFLSFFVFQIWRMQVAELLPDASPAVVAAQTTPPQTVSVSATPASIVSLL